MRACNAFHDGQSQPAALVPHPAPAVESLEHARQILHLDPAAASRGGFDRPILHGLCTYGFATRAIVNELLGGNVDRLKEFSARFSSSVYPGDTLTTQGWKGDGGYIIQAKTGNNVVLSNALAMVE